MKTRPVVALLVAMLAGGVWIARQFGAIATLEQQNALLRKHLAAGPGAAFTTARPATPKKSALDRKPVDWSAAAKELSNHDRSYPGHTDRVWERLRSMDREALIAALEEIARADLSLKDRRTMERWLVSLLAEKDPEYVVKEFLHRLHDKDWVYILSGALGRWAKDDPAKAVAWFEEQVAAGKIEGKGIFNRHGLLISFKRALVSVLLSSDPAAAGRQLAALPEAERIDVIHGFLGAAGGDVSKVDQLAWANLLREQLPEADRLQAITWPVTDRGEGGTIEYAEVEDYFSRIDATPAEREACILGLAEECRFPRESGGYFGTTAADLDAFREWIGRNAPELVDQATAGALSGLSILSGFDYPQWAAFTLRCHQAGGSDDILIPLLEAHNASENIALARTLAARLTDENRRAAFLEKLDRTPPGP